MSKANEEYKKERFFTYVQNDKVVANFRATVGSFNAPVLSKH